MKMADLHEQTWREIKSIIFPRNNEKKAICDEIFTINKTFHELVRFKIKGYEYVLDFYYILSNTGEKFSFSR